MHQGWIRGAAMAALMAGMLGAAAPAAAQVQPPAGPAWHPQGWFVEAGHSRHDSRIVGLGLRWPWRWQARQGSLGAATELSVSDWVSEVDSHWRQTGQVALVPLLRWRPSEGRSPWFVEGGIGLSLHAHDFDEQSARMSTRWNFYDVLAVGRQVGARHEWSLRLVHVSNGGARNPNPGADLLMLRWTSYF